MIPSLQSSETEPSCEVSSASVEEHKDVFPLPLTPLERFLVQCDTQRSSMVIRVVMRFTGELQLDTLLSTLRTTIRRHPLLTSRLSNQRFRPHWIVGTPDKVVTNRVAGSVFAPDNGPFGKRIDLTQSAGLQVEIRLMDDGLKIIADVHHAVTDGNGIRQCLLEWLHLYHCEVNGLSPKLNIIDPNRLLQRDRFPQPSSVAPVSFREAVRNLFCTVRGRTSRWSLKRSKEFQRHGPAHAYCVEHVLSVDEAALIRQRLADWRITFNELMLVACMSTFARLAPSGSHNDRVTVLNPTDLRLPSDRTMSSTNRFGFAFVRRLRSDCANPAELLRGIHDEMNYVRNGYIGAEFLKGLRNAARIPGGVDFIRRMGLFVPSLQWTCLGDVTRGARRLMSWQDGVLHTGGLRLESTSGFAPFAEGVPLSIASCETGHRITLTLRSSAEHISSDQSKEFLAMLVNQICTMDLPREKSDVNKNYVADGL